MQFRSRASGLVIGSKVGKIEFKNGLIDVDVEADRLGVKPKQIVDAVKASESFRRGNVIAEGTEEKTKE